MKILIAIAAVMIVAAILLGIYATNRPPVSLEQEVAAVSARVCLSGERLDYSTTPNGALNFQCVTGAGTARDVSQQVTVLIPAASSKVFTQLTTAFGILMMGISLGCLGSILLIAGIIGAFLGRRKGEDYLIRS